MRSRTSGRGGRPEATSSTTRSTTATREGSGAGPAGAGRVAGIRPPEPGEEELDEATATALDEVNRRFYAAEAAEFSARRERPWSGFEALLPLLPPPDAGGAPLRVLDAGCGNARLARFLADRTARPVAYLGIDREPRMLAEARVRTARLRRGFEVALEVRDLVAAGLPAAAEGRFDLVCAFGLLHAVPGEARRRRCTGELARALAPGGLLALAVWRFTGRRDFARRSIPFSELAPRTGIRLPGRPDAGDHLLLFGGRSCRYCHEVDDAELERLTASLGLRAVRDFEGTGGDQNRYRVLGREGAPR